MSDYNLVFHTLDKILESLDIILERSEMITSVDDFLMLRRFFGFVQKIFLY